MSHINDSLDLKLASLLKIYFNLFEILLVFGHSPGKGDTILIIDKNVSKQKKTKCRYYQKT